MDHMPIPEFVVLRSERTSLQTLKVLEDRASLNDASLKGESVNDRPVYDGPINHGPTHDKPSNDKPEQFFSTEDLLLLERIAACVLPQAKAGTHVQVAQGVDARLTRGEGMGWRYAALPIETEAYRMALYLLRSHMSELSIDIAAVDGNGLLQLLEAVQLKRYDGETFVLSRWFENFKTEVVRYWLADPQTMALLRYEGFADELLMPQVPGATR